MYSLSVWIVLLLLVQQSISQGARKSNPCVEQKTCGACLAAGPECGWCKQTSEEFKIHDRCNLLDHLLAAGCDDDHIVRPENEAAAVKNLPPRNAEDGDPAIQMSPQEMELKIRAKSPYTFRIDYRQAENYPVDLYYIMDLSYSMRDDKGKVAELGELLSHEMEKITEDFRLGFGSFIDKKTMPYVNTVPDKLVSPCEGCVPPYGFKNQLSLTDDPTQFKESVENAKISGNLDSPEGGFDAMMQAIVCQNDIGWRTYARRMLLYSTDEAFHSAGDGKLGGIVKPNDGICHLDTSGSYSESLTQDYPSISQIANKVQDNNVNVIFAVTAERVDLYKNLSPFIQGSVVGELANDSSNVVDLVKDNYEKISSIVELKADAPAGVEVTFKAHCLNGEIRDSGRCENVGIGHNVSYEVTIEVKECPKDADQWQQTVEIYSVGLAEKLVITLDMICQCDCELPEHEVANSEMCNYNGTYECGACTCKPGLYGKTCECDGGTSQTADYDRQCRQTNTSEVCEGHGECVCGICDCFPVSNIAPAHKYSGAYCECDNYACDYYDDMVCGGPARGVCVCGQCSCNTGYKGDTCECATSPEPCRAENGKICNDKGTCTCGKCTCDKDNYYYRGATCSDCPTCPGKCEANKDCVQCMAFGTGNIETEDECKANCSYIEIEDSVEEKPRWKFCKFRDEIDSCYFYFIYQYDGERVVAQKSKECPAPLKVGWIIFAIILLILLLGLLLLILWKVFVTLYDRREYARFEKEVEKAKWDMAENPIFKPATSTYTNPMKKE